MLTSGTAAVLALSLLLLTVLLSSGIGAIMCRILRLPWSLKTVALDTTLALVVALVSIYLGVKISIAFGQLSSGVTWVMLVATGSVILRHLIRRKRRLGAP